MFPASTPHSSLSQRAIFAGTTAFVLLCPAWAAVAQQPAGGKPNLLTNASFEEEQKDWAFNCWHKKGTATIDTVEKKDGQASIRIDNATGGDDSFLKQTIAVKPKTRYRLSGYIKTKDVVGKGAGATL